MQKKMEWEGGFLLCCFFGDAGIGWVMNPVAPPGLSGMWLVFRQGFHFIPPPA